LSFIEGGFISLPQMTNGNSTLANSPVLSKRFPVHQIAAFAFAYAGQNQKDHDALDRAVRKGSVKAIFEEGE